eukprot:TRINITY_DN75_c0_g1_i2.p1 TRINITY_DN75_c0_g1~~TRINITY_DN75_c0_g1_i2.p1  ORF type:complete len:760 (+),score=179.49 TRINITY_DN75_c0_g1_i2:91-2370(+)
MVAAAIVAASASFAAGADFKSFSCPSFSSGCSHTNTDTSDQAVSLFFQFEPAQGESSANFRCSGDGLTYCSRSWSAEASGSAGDCFFVLGAGRSFSCSGQGTVHVIGAHASKMSSAAVASSPSQAETLPCTGSSGCSYKNSGKDAWVGLEFSADTNSSLSCKYGSLEVCSWGTNSAGGGGSCNFILPASATLRCQGNVKVTSAAALRFADAVLDASAEFEPKWSCPNKTYPEPNMCDCSVTNPHVDKDIAVAVSAQSVDGNYNSFHCYYGGANVCAWGSNRDDKGDKGGCYFILAAGAELTCAMQWGAASFSFSSAVAMKKSLFGASAVGVRSSGPVAAVPAMSERMLRQKFSEWKRQYGKVYSSVAEEELRFSNFREHVTLAGKKERYNNLADLSRADFEKSYRGCGRAAARNESTVWRGSGSTGSLPKSVDWRKKSVITPVKDQGQCGSCWSFSTTGAIESAWAIAGNPLVSLSEQELVSCDKGDGNSGCGGGWPDKAMDWVKANGIDTEESYPYASGSGNAPGCTSGHQKAAATVTGHFDVAHDEDAMAEYVANHGPLSVCVDAMTQLWWPYTGGIMTGCCNHECDHAVLIVGYGEENGKKFWWIKNSWNANWGEGGYVRLERGTNQCGITTAPVGVLVEGAPVPSTPAPTPPSACPPQAVMQGSSCMWINGTNGVVFPSAEAIDEYCDYFSKGYFGYVWPKSAGAAPCPTVAASGSSDTEYFCTWNNGKSGVYWPASGATADCGSLKQGKIGFSW